MTNEIRRKVEALLTNNDLYKFAERMCEKYKIHPIEDYPQTFDSEVMKSAARRQMYVNKASQLLRRAFFLGAKENEILCISEYLIVLTKSTDNSLDYRRAEEELKIAALEKKYDKNAFYHLDIPYEEFERWTKQNGGYGVSIKDESN